MTREIGRRTEMAIAFVGCVVPDEPAYAGAAFSRSGNMFQINLLAGLKTQAIELDVISFRPVASFPRSDTVWVRGGTVELEPGLRADLLPFINVTPLKQAFIGCAALLAVLGWAWRRRAVPHRFVYCYNLSVPAGLLMLLGARLGGAKIVASLNDVNVPGRTVRASVFTKLDFWLQKTVIPRLDGHIVVSDQIARDLAPGRTYLRIEGGLPRELEQDIPRKRTGRDTDAFKIVSAGSITEANGVGILLDAFNNLSGNHFRLRIAGRGPLEAAVRSAADADPRIEYYGFLPFDRVLSLYADADVLVSVRLTRAIDTRYFFPGKLMEYLGSGVPVITTCTGHVEEEFGDFAFLLRDETAEALAKLILHIAALSPAERETVGRRARAYFLAEKTWNAQAARITRYLSRLADRTP